MATNRFPYDLPSEEALIELIRRDRPQEDARKGSVVFGDLFHSPTLEDPGRTYIEMTNNRTARKSWFVYRRLYIETVINEYLDPTEDPIITVDIPGSITSAKIVEAINAKYKLRLDNSDTDISSAVLGQGQMEYDLVMKTDSYAYYGTAKVYINYFVTPIIARVTEDNIPRLLENGKYREMEVTN